MEEPSSGIISPSGESSVSVEQEAGNGSIATSLDDRLSDTISKVSLSSLRTPPTRKAKRIRFFRNGDKFYTGVVMAVTPERYRSFDSLASDLTRALVSNVTLPNGVRTIYTMDGKKVQGIRELEDGKCYVVSGQGESFKKVEYSTARVRRGNSLSGLPQSPAGAGRQISSVPACVRARIITCIRNGTKPRKLVRLLLNKRNSPSLEHVFEAITEVVKLDSGAVRRVYATDERPVISLEQFFGDTAVFWAYGPEKPTPDDFVLDVEEMRILQSFQRGPFMNKRQSGPIPPMPRKSRKRTTNPPQARTAKPSACDLPLPLRMHFNVGYVIGEGSFAVVRHCVHKPMQTTGIEHRASKHRPIIVRYFGWWGQITKNDWSMLRCTMLDACSLHWPLRASGNEYAVKIIDKVRSPFNQSMIANEVAILRTVCHPNIISLICEQETEEEIFLVMELVQGDLFDAIREATKFSEADASIIIGDLISALAYLHSHQIVHRDVKPENLLMQCHGNKVGCLKLGDFGLAQVVTEPLYAVCGTPTYVAPEILAETGYGLKIDVWAVGVILYILLCGFPPFSSTNDDQEELFERILSGQYEFTAPYWDPISDLAKQLISNMLQAQPELRFSAEDVLDHPWLVSFLGGEQTVSGGRSSRKSSEQYGNKQREPLKLVHQRKFDFFAERKKSEPIDLSRHIYQDEPDVKNIGPEASRPVNETFSSSEKGGDRVPLSPERLRLYKEFANLVGKNNDDETTLRATRKNGDDKNSASMSSNETEKILSITGQKDDKQSSTSSFDSPSKKHSFKTNFNENSQIHSSPLTTPKRPRDEISIVDKRQSDKNKIPKTPLNRPKRTNLCKQKRFAKSNEFVTSETSDSFVNILAENSTTRRNESSVSCRSRESTDISEFASDEKMPEISNKLDGSSLDRSSGENSQKVNNRRKSAGAYRQTKPVVEPSRNSRQSLIPVQNNGQTKQNAKIAALSRIPINETVKLRHKKSVAPSGQSTNSRNERYSCASPITSRSSEAKNGSKTPTVGARTTVGNDDGKSRRTQHESNSRQLRK